MSASIVVSSTVVYDMLLRCKKKDMFIFIVRNGSGGKTYSWNGWNTFNEQNLVTGRERLIRTRLIRSSI